MFYRSHQDIPHLLRTQGTDAEKLHKMLLVNEKKKPDEAVYTKGVVYLWIMVISSIRPQDAGFCKNFIGTVWAVFTKLNFNFL